LNRRIEQAANFFNPNVLDGNWLWLFFLLGRVIPLYRWQIAPAVSAFDSLFSDYFRAERANLSMMA
jgi:hypothetical protein